MMIKLTGRERSWWDVKKLASLVSVELIVKCHRASVQKNCQAETGVYSKFKRPPSLNPFSTSGKAHFL